jgi:hypothetical protein
MDYTPCAFSDSQNPHITSNGHELALTVLFESGLQHLADSPESFLAQPKEVQQFLGEIPTVWDETRLVSGYPGESVVLARRHGSTWYVAGLNAESVAKTVTITMKEWAGRTVDYYVDDAKKGPQLRQLKVDKNGLVRITLQPMGGVILQ